MGASARGRGDRRMENSLAGCVVPMNSKSWETRLVFKALALPGSRLEPAGLAQTRGIMVGFSTVALLAVTIGLGRHRGRRAGVTIEAAIAR